MATSPIFLGKNLLQTTPKAISGKSLEMDGESWFLIENYDQMPPFFMSIVSPSDHWLFLSSTGALSAGRIDAEHALFPYYTDDKIHDSAELTGSKSIFLVEKGEKTYLWEPFSEKYAGIYRLRRNVYKHRLGHRIIFEEINEELEIRFRYSWNSSERLGFVRQAELLNLGGNAAKVRMLDGVQNLLPAGVTTGMQNDRSTLIDAYKKAELEADCGLGIFALSAIPVDRPEPSEALLATTVWSEGIQAEAYLLCNRQLDAFRKGEKVTPEIDIRAERGAYFIHARLSLQAKQAQRWSLVIEGDRDATEVAALRSLILSGQDLAALLRAEIQAGTDRLSQIIGSADGLQASADELSSARHSSNVLFNVMRGGLFWRNQELLSQDFLAFLQSHNPGIADQLAARIAAAPEVISHDQLFEWADSPQAQRLSYEYLPLYFSRRHGDPSRPWNRFAIHTQDEQGNPIFSYQGNWRDIFQNWEALAWSYPAFIRSMIAKFVNASTADGYNPYRITRDGIDWEVLEPHDPWAYIGYWGDHQIIYLQKLMEVAQAFYPGSLDQFLKQEIFAYANVPYRIKGLEDLLQNPHDTIDFDDAAEAEIQKRVAATGADGKLIWNKKGEVYLVNFTEKLLVTGLTKLSNFILEGGIWMNTQRPEWNDANNALVGYGISVVTLCYLRRFQAFCESLFQTGEESYQLSSEVVSWFQQSLQVFEAHEELLKNDISDEQRLEMLRALGEPAENYRKTIYGSGFSGAKQYVRKAELLRFFSLTQQYIDHSIQTNQRKDLLFHAYNLWELNDEKGLQLLYLYEMLEGQVAALSSGLLATGAVVQVLDSLKQSALFRKDQYSYILYPNRDLPRFTVKNHIPPAAFQKSSLFQKMVSQKDHRLVTQDVAGEGHFQGNIRNAKDVSRILGELKQEESYRELVLQEEKSILDVFEKMFDHQSFTGRSGTFFGYEGLGSIYWHMVSKLLLAVAENYFAGKAKGSPQGLLDRLVAHYYEIRAGIGLNKSPELYGAFPTDPYSHTPAHLGAQQPGMTGQVKEDILARYYELGLVVEAGEIHFRSYLLRSSEFFAQPAPFTCYDVQGTARQITLPAKSLAFTFCQTLMVYHLSDEPYVHVYHASGEVSRHQELMLSAELSKDIFARNGKILKIEVGLSAGLG